MRRLLVAAATLTIAGCTHKPADGFGSQYFATPNGEVELQFPAGWYEPKEETPFDLQCFSKHRRMTTGVFLFVEEDLAEGFSSKELFATQVDDLRRKRKNFEVFEEQHTTQLEKKFLTTVVYSAEKGSSRFYYRYTLVEFNENPGTLLIVLQVVAPSYWAKYKPILEEITKSARIKS